MSLPRRRRQSVRVRVDTHVTVLTDALTAADPGALAAMAGTQLHTAAAGLRLYHRSCVQRERAARKRAATFPADHPERAAALRLASSWHDRAEAVMSGLIVLWAAAASVGGHCNVPPQPTASPPPSDQSAESAEKEGAAPSRPLHRMTLGPSGPPAVPATRQLLLVDLLT